MVIVVVFVAMVIVVDIFVVLVVAAGAGALSCNLIGAILQDNFSWNILIRVFVFVDRGSTCRPGQGFSLPPKKRAFTLVRSAMAYNVGNLKVQVAAAMIRRSPWLS